MKIKIIVILLFTPFFLFSQNIKIKGKVLNNEGNAIAFANIFITPLQDTSQIITGTLSDMEGKYSIEVKQGGKYILNASYIGFMTQKDTIELFHKNINQNMVLKKSSIKLSEVEITANSVKREIDKKTFYVTDNMKAKSISALDVLDNISDLNVNTLNNKVTTKRNETVKILINGIDATELDLLSIKPENILKIEYYDIVPARYTNNNNIKGVVNVITKKSLEGFSGSIDSKAAVTTGFNDDLINFSYVHHNTKISLNYFFSLRNYQDRRVDEELKYKINNTNYEKEKIGQSSPFAYTLHNNNLNIINKKDSDYIFQFEAKFFGYNKNSTTLQNLNYLIGDSSVNGSAKYSGSFKTLQPKFDLYFEKELKNNKKIIADVYYSYFNSKYNYKINEISNDSTIMDISTINNAIKQSITPECIFSSPIKNGVYDIGLKYFYSNSLQNIENFVNNKNETNSSSEANLFADFKKEIKSFSIYTKLGLSYDTYSETINSFSFLSFTPSITLSYSLSKNSSIRLNGSQNPKIPLLSQLSNSVIPIDNFIVFSGNNNLKPYLSKTIDFSYSLEKNKIQISPTLTYINSNNPFDKIYTLDKSNDFYVKTYDNIDFSDEIDLGLSFTYKPFESGFADFNIYSVIYHQRNKINSKINSNTDLFLKVTTSFYYKHFSLKFNYRSPYDNLYGDFIYTPAPEVNIELDYKHKNLLFGLSIYYPFSDSWYASNRAAKNAIVYDTHKTSIYDNGNMVVFHLRYNLAIGNKGFNTQKKINNNDGDTGVLKVN